MTVRKAGVEKNARFPHCFVSTIWAIRMKEFIRTSVWNGILLPKLFWPTVRKNCSSDRENFLIFEAEGQEFAKNLRSLEQFIQTVEGHNSFWWQNAF